MISSKPKVIINQHQCELIAERILPLRFRAVHAERPLISFSASLETKLRTYLLLTAICHQTYTLINRKKNLVGWNYLEDRFIAFGRSNSQLIDPKYLSTLNSEELSNQLRILFTEDSGSEKCTLDRLAERSKFIIQIADVLNKKYDGKVENMFKYKDGKIANSVPNLYEMLTDFDAYADPFKKKSTLFLQLVHEAKLYELRDLDLIVPIMDYHMQRLLLRTGCIEVVDSALRKALQSKESLKTDNDVRKASIEAIKIISKYSNKNYFELDGILWSLGRSCCQEKMICVDGTCNKKPCTFFMYLDLPQHEYCIFGKVCKGYMNKEYRKYWEPIVNTTCY